MSAPRAVLLLFLATAGIAVAYGSAFATGGAPGWAAWLMMASLATMVAGMMLLGIRGAARGRGLMVGAIGFTWLVVVACFGLYYRWRVRNVPAEERVSAIAFVPIAFLMPVTYALMTPLALFTLDSGSWETRGHQPEPEAEAVPGTSAGDFVTGQHVLVPALAGEPVRAARAVSHQTGSHAQLPAA